MKTIKASRVSGDLYDCTYSDSNGLDRLDKEAIVRVAHRYGYVLIEVDQSAYRGEGEPVMFTTTPGQWPTLRALRQ